MMKLLLIFFFSYCHCFSALDLEHLLPQAIYYVLHSEVLMLRGIVEAILNHGMSIKIKIIRYVEYVTRMIEII